MRGPFYACLNNMADCSCHDHKPTAKTAIEVRSLKVSFGGQPILKGVDMTVPQGSVVALIGPNGSGKTTLLRCLLGLQQPDAGEVRIFGQNNLRKVMPRVGYVPQKLQLERSFILSVREFLSLRLAESRNWFWHSRKWADETMRATMAEIGIEPLLDRPIAALSGGQLQRVLIAFSLLKHPDLLLLDEPTAGVDSPGEDTFYDLIQQVHKHHGMTVVLVSHDLSMVYRHASRVYALNGTICCEGTPEEVMNAESLKEAYGIHVSSYHHHHVH